ncbi:hypothetical protein PBY51_005522 [Eleginops maclovinus]|uniref:Uncharacterized protein n=1 Tax=Eleginops maclovinus TaxID=56733 RepID=A0AAN7X0K1_ELEMC|nr:hypothetical protein PBY51_005522 [Eleginops maclovinus]
MCGCRTIYQLERALGEAAHYPWLPQHLIHIVYQQPVNHGDVKSGSNIGLAELKAKSSKDWKEIHELHADA